MKIGVFAGSFCPITVGHVDAITRAAALVDKLYVVVGVNPSKKYVFSIDERLQMVSQSIRLANVECVAWEGMLTDFCQKVGATVMIKVARNAAEMQEVLDLADVNRDFWDGETVFVVADKRYRYVSSSLVRELAGLGKDFSAYVPEEVYKTIKERLN